MKSPIDVRAGHPPGSMEHRCDAGSTRPLASKDQAAPVRLLTLALTAAAMLATTAQTPPSPAWAAEAAPEAPPAAAPLAGLLVAPTRVVFEGRQRSAQITVVNRGIATALFRISLVRMRMKPNGALEPITTPNPGEAFADTLVRFSPRQVELEPQVPRTIRLLMSLPPDLPEGEYRSHLLIREVPSENLPMAFDPATGRQWQVRLTALVGTAIPVIVRYGRTHADLSLFGAQLERPRFADAPPVLRVRLRRTGNQSVYGDVLVMHVPRSGQPVLAGAMRGLAVYTPDSSRAIAIPLVGIPQGRLSDGRLEIAFTEPGRSEVKRATANLDLP